MQKETEALLENYYAAFNRGDMQDFLKLLTDDVIHDINQGEREIGQSAFADFMSRMNHHYKEQLSDIAIMVNGDGSRAAAEFTVHGEYVATDSGLPEAKGQTYTLPAGAFFEVKDGKIARISNFYNLQDWITQVS